MPHIKTCFFALKIFQKKKIQAFTPPPQGFGIITNSPIHQRNSGIFPKPNRFCQKKISKKLKKKKVKKNPYSPKKK